MDESLEEAMRSVVNFMNADKYVRDTTINSIETCGNSGLSDLGDELSRRFKSRYGLDFKKEELAGELAKAYGYGIIRFVGEYDSQSLDAGDLLNKEGIVDSESVEKAESRKRFVANMIGSLETVNDVYGGRHPGTHWNDFVNRGYDFIRDKIKDTYGDKVSERFEFYEYYDLRDELKVGINGILTRAHAMSSSDFLYLSQASIALGEKENALRTDIEEKNNETLASLSLPACNL